MAIKDLLTGTKNLASDIVYDTGKPLGKLAKGAGKVVGKVGKVAAPLVAIGSLVSDMNQQSDPNRSAIMLEQLKNKEGYIPGDESSVFGAMGNTGEIAKTQVKDSLKGLANYVLPKNMEFQKTFDSNLTNNLPDNTALGKLFGSNTNIKSTPVDNITRANFGKEVNTIPNTNNYTPSNVNITANTSLASGLKNDLQGLNNFNVERNGTQLADRNLLSDRLNKLFTQQDELDGGSGSFGEALARRSAQARTTNQIRDIGSLVNTANNLNQEDINSANNLNFKNLESQRNNVLDTARFGLNENDSNVRNDINREKLPLELDSLKSGLTGNNISNQMNQIQLNQTNDLINAKKGVGFEENSKIANDLRATPGYYDLLKTNIEAVNNTRKLNGQNPLSSVEQQQLDRELSKSEVDKLRQNTIANLGGNTKSQVTAEGDTETGGIKYKGTPAEVKKLIEDSMKAKQPKVSGT